MKVQQRLNVMLKNLILIKECQILKLHYLIFMGIEIVDTKEKEIYLDV